MKQILVMVMSLFITFDASACSNISALDNKDSDNQSNMDTLIVYFSRTGENYGVGIINVGNTAMMASYIKEVTGGKLFEIIPTVAYPNSYEETKLISHKERDEDLRPAIKNKLSDLDKYSVVFIGMPIWYGGPPMIMQTFYEAYPELADKTLIPFGTHEGSGTTSLAPLLKRYFPKANIKETLGLTGRDVKSAPTKSRKAVENWVNKLKITKQ